MAFSKKQIPSPTEATSNPAMEGPMSRAPFTMEELRAIAFPKSSLFSTISTTKDWRIGMSNALTMPRTRLRRIICHTCTNPVRTTNARKAACTMARVWVAIRRRRLSQRSAHTGKKGDKDSRNLAGEADNAEEHGRSSQAINKPAHGNLLHPRPYKGNTLPCDE